MSDAPSPGAVLETPEEHQQAEGVDGAGEPVGSTSTVRDMMLATDPERPLAEIEAPYDPDRGGLTRVYRGLQKALDMEGTPAIVDVLIGSIEAVKAADLEGVPGSDDPGGDQDDDAGDDLGELGIDGEGV